MEQTRLINTTMALWPMLAKAAGLAGDTPEVQPLLIRPAKDAARVILALEVGGKPLIIKHEYTRNGAENRHFTDSLTAQSKARLRMTGNMLDLKVPEILAHLPHQNLVLMERHPGDQAAHLIEEARSRLDRREVLAAGGRWLGAFHRALPLAQRPYQTRFVVNHLRRQRSAIDAGHIRVAEPATFLRLSDAIEASAIAYDGKPVRHAWQHGDFTTRNLLIDATSTAAIDFKPEHSAPIGHDIARFVVDYAALYGEHPKIPDGQILQGPDRAAFFRAYGLDERADPSIRFLYGAQSLSDWSRIPAREDQRSLMQVLRLQGLMQTTRRLYPTLRAA
ncbi:MAG: phosphotransferase [Albidovulum sp.]